MSAKLQDLLPRDAGTRLPEPVRRALTDMGVACNEAAVAVNHALSFVLQATNNREILTATAAGAVRAAVAYDLERVADRTYEQTLVVLSRAATSYAVYAAQVAMAVAQGNAAPLPGRETLRPSDLIAALGLYLPRIRFTDAAADASSVDQQNAMVQADYQTLTQVITEQLEGHNAAAYDDPAAVAVGAADLEISAALPEALHSYAATLTWAVGTLTGIRDDSDAGPDGVVA